MKHLWECDHPYYCSEENYFRGRSETVAEYDSWAGWLNLNLGMDVDYNLIFRWDWKPIDEDGGHPKDDAARDYQLSLNIIGQRKGIYRCDIIKVSRLDEPSVVEILQRHFDRMLENWSPFAGRKGAADA